MTEAYPHAARAGSPSTGDGWDWARFLEDEETRRARAEDHADALLRGERPTGLFAAWRFADAPDWVAVIAEELLLDRVRPSASALQLVLGPWPAPHDLAETNTAYAHRLRLSRRCRGEGVPTDRRSRLVWALVTLDILGDQVEVMERRSWVQAWVARPERDERTVHLWRSLLQNDRWAHAERWQTDFVPAARSAVASVFESKHFPPDVVRQARRDVSEGFLWILFGEQDQIPAWQQIAARVLERTDVPPNSTLRWLTPSQRERFAHCAVRRLHTGRTLARAWPDRPGLWGRATALIHHLEQTGDIEPLLDLHVVLRLLDGWQSPVRADLHRSRKTIWANRRRVLSRARALLSEDPTVWAADLLALDALYNRTRDAISRFFVDVAWRHVSREPTFDPRRAADPPCTLQLDDWPRPPLRLLQTWVKLTAIRGRLDHLVRWVHTGSTGDRDTPWSRLLQVLPTSVCDPRPPDSKKRGYSRIRSELWGILPSLIEHALDGLLDVASLQYTPDAPRLARERLERDWHPEIPLRRFTRANLDEIVRRVQERFSKEGGE